MSDISNFDFICINRTNAKDWKQAYITWQEKYVAAFHKDPYEADFPCWPNVYDYIENNVSHIMNSSTDEIDALLFIIDKDWDHGNLISFFKNHDEVLFFLSKQALSGDYKDAKAQFASALDKLDVNIKEREELLIQLTKDENEYVVRKALMTLGRLQYHQIEKIVQQLWTLPNEHMKMACLQALRDKGSAALEDYIRKALDETGENIRSFAQKLV